MSNVGELQMSTLTSFDTEHMADPQSAFAELCRQFPVHWAAANRDERVYAHADESDLDRGGRNAPHVAFGARTARQQSTTHTSGEWSCRSPLSPNMPN